MEESCKEWREGVDALFDAADGLLSARDPVFLRARPTRGREPVEAALADELGDPGGRPRTCEERLFSDQ